MALACLLHVPMPARFSYAFLVASAARMTSQVPQVDVGERVLDVRGHERVGHHPDAPYHGDPRPARKEGEGAADEQALARFSLAAPPAAVVAGEGDPGDGQHGQQQRDSHVGEDHPPRVGEGANRRVDGDGVSCPRAPRHPPECGLQHRQRAQRRGDEVDPQPERRNVGAEAC
eukprot:scaffold1309_cov117-Isochrysis_galbana.AAC.11